MTETSARLALPLLAPGQAQKELFHNEALALLDMAVQASVVAVGLDSPPDAPAPGQCWIVGAAPTGGWRGHADAIAGWTPGGWRFLSPVAGMAVWDIGAGRVARWSGEAWVSGTLAGARLLVDGVQVVGARRGAIPAPAGGGTVDVEARAAVAAILAALAGHGLIHG